jgi:hypothetical protein
MNESKRAYRHSALGRFSSPQTRWHARLANDLARLATVDVDVRRISNPPFKIKNLWVMTSLERLGYFRDPPEIFQNSLSGFRDRQP